jgi:threonine dehydrogenase-like Zn-dependent dehydrogenase
VRGARLRRDRPQKKGDTIAVIGLGPIGLMFVKLAKLYGCRVIAVGGARRSWTARRAGRRRVDRAERTGRSRGAIRG